MKHNIRDSKGCFCKKASAEVVTKGYKGFKKGLVCLKKQYEVGKTYEEQGKTICEEGMMHFCENPLDVLNFYPAVDPATGEPNEFAKVEAIGGVIKDHNKSATNKLRIVKKISLKELIKATTKAGNESDTATVGNCSPAITAGFGHHSATVGDSSNAATSDDYSNTATAGGYSHATTAGVYAHAATAGDRSYAAATGRCSNAVTAGGWSHAATARDYSNAITAGYSSYAAATGRCSIAAALGKNSKAKAALGSWIVLAEYDSNSKPLFVKTAKVDGKKIKANTFYKLKNGEFVKA